MEPSHPVVKYRLFIIILFGALSLGFGAFIPFAAIEPDIQSMIPADAPSLETAPEAPTDEPSGLEPALERYLRPGLFCIFTQYFREPWYNKRG